MPTTFENCGHGEPFSSRREYCLQEREDLDVYARMALEALDRVVYGSPWTDEFAGYFSKSEQAGEQYVSFLRGDVTGDGAWPLSETSLTIRHHLAKPSGVESYTVEHSHRVYQVGGTLTLPVRYMFACAPGHLVEATVEAYDYDGDCRNMLAVVDEQGRLAPNSLKRSGYISRAMTEYDYAGLIENLDAAERYLDAMRDDEALVSVMMKL